MVLEARLRSVVPQLSWEPLSLRWTQQKKLTDGSGSNGDAFGHAVSVDESTGVIAVSSVFQGGASFNQMPKVFVYTGSGSSSSWSLAGTLTEPNGIVGSDFGISVSVNGTSIAVGDDNVDGAFTSAKSFVFSAIGNDWSSPSNVTLDYPGNRGESFGFSVSLSGSTLLVGAPQIHGIGNGSAYLFTKSGSNWSLSNGGNALVPDDGVNDDGFGGSVAVDEAAQLALVGEPARGNDHRGGVYVFSSTNGSTWAQSEVLDAGSSATIAAGFGFSVSLEPISVLATRVMLM